MQQHNTARERPDKAPAPATNRSEKPTTPQQAQILTLGQRRARGKFKDPSVMYDLRGRGGIAGDTIRAQYKHVPTEAEGQCSGLLPLYALNHSLREGHQHANTALGPVQGTEHGAEPTPKELQGKYWEQGWLQQWTTMKQTEQPQKALPPMSSH